MDALCLAVLHHRHEGAQCIQRARKACVGVELTQDFLDLIDCQPGIQRGAQGRFEAVKIAGRRESGDWQDGLLACGESRLGVHVDIRGVGGPQRRLARWGGGCVGRASDDAIGQRQRGWGKAG